MTDHAFLERDKTWIDVGEEKFINLSSVTSIQHKNFYRKYKHSTKTYIDMHIFNYKIIFGNDNIIIDERDKNFIKITNFLKARKL